MTPRTTRDDEDEDADERPEQRDVSPGRLKPSHGQLTEEKRIRYRQLTEEKQIRYKLGQLNDNDVNFVYTNLLSL